MILLYHISTLQNMEYTFFVLETYLKTEKYITLVCTVPYSRTFTCFGFKIVLVYIFMMCLILSNEIYTREDSNLVTGVYSSCSVKYSVLYMSYVRPLKINKCLFVLEYIHTVVPLVPCETSFKVQVRNFT